MAKTVIASGKPMTDGQIDNLVDKLRAAARKHRAEFASDAAQQVLGVENLGMELLEPFRRRVDAVSGMIVRHVKVDRTRTPQQVLDATGRRQYVDPDVVASMPGCGDGIEELDVCFFPLRRFASDEEVEEACKLRGLERLADPYVVAQVNTDDPEFADTHPNGTHWKDAEGKWCYFAFDRWHGERLVNVHRRALDWRDSWWFAGLRK